MEPILAECYGPYVMASLYQIQEGSSKAAVSYCQKIAAESKHTAFLLPGSNGIEWTDVFANDEQLVALWNIARQKCLSESEAARKLTKRRSP
jgi:hypothetical protein